MISYAQAFKSKNIGLKTTFLAAMIALAGCGGGGSEGFFTGSPSNNTENPDSGSNPETPAPIEAKILSIGQNKASLSAGTEDNMDITIRTLDEKGGIIKGASVNLEILDPLNAGANLTTETTIVSNESGIASTALQLANSTLATRLNRSITLRISSGKIVQDVVIQVQGSSVEISTDTGSLNSGQSANINVTTRDAAGNALAGAKVKLIDSSNNQVSGTSIETTNKSGLATFKIPFSVVDQAEGKKLSINAQVAPAENATSFQTSTENVSIIALVRNDSMSVTSNNVNAVKIGEAVPISVKIIASTEAELRNKTVAFDTTNGTLTSTQVPLTEPVQENGKWVSVASTQLIGSVAGIATVSAQFGNNVVYATQQIQAGEPKTITLQSELAVLAPGSSTKVIALVKDANGSPVTNTTVKFTVEKDTSSTGKISQPTATTDDSGKATVIYTAGAAQTLGGGVVIHASASNAIYPQPVYSDKLTLTVGTQSAYITISKNNLVIKEDTNGSSTYYFKDFSASVTDTAGNPIANQKVSISVDLEGFAKGFWQFIPVYDPTSILGYSEEWVRYFTDPDNRYKKISDSWAICPSNEFQNPISILSMNKEVLGTNAAFVTDNQGKFDFKIRYGRNYANWVYSVINASTTVSTKENKTALAFIPPVLADDVDELGRVERPDMISPYGKDFSNCNNYR